MNSGLSQQGSEDKKISVQSGVVLELQSNEDWFAGARVLQVLRPQINSDAFVKDRDRLTSEGYRLIGLK